MEKIADIELTSIDATDPKPRSFANNANAVLIQVINVTFFDFKFLCVISYGLSMEC